MMTRMGDNQGFIELGHRGFPKLFSSKEERERHLSTEQPLGHSMKQQLQAGTHFSIVEMAMKMRRMMKMRMMMGMKMKRMMRESHCENETVLI